MLFSWSVVINPASYKVESGENTTVDVVVSNTYTPGSLTVQKTVETNDAVGLTVPDFSITIKGPSYPNGDTKVFNQTKGMTQTWNDLIPGDYTVTEPDVAAPWSEQISPETYKVTSGENTSVDVTVTNTYAPGSLTVHKAVVTNGAVGLTIPDFSITIKGPSYPNGDTKVFNQTKGMEQTWRIFPFCCCPRGCRRGILLGWRRNEQSMEVQDAGYRLDRQDPRLGHFQF